MKLQRKMFIGLVATVLLVLTAMIVFWALRHVEEHHRATHPHLLAAAQANDIEGFAQYVDFAGLYRQESNGKGGYVHGISILIKDQGPSDSEISHQLRSCLGHPLGLMMLYQHLTNESKTEDLYHGGALSLQDRLSVLLHVLWRDWSASPQDTVGAFYTGTVPVAGSRLIPSVELSTTYMAGFRKHPLSDRYKLAKLTLIFDDESQIQQLADHLLPTCQVEYGYKPAAI